MSSRTDVLPKEYCEQLELLRADVKPLSIETIKEEIETELGKKIEEVFDAVFIGSGAGLPKFMGIPGENANGVFSANEYLTRSNLMKAFDENSTTPIMRAKKVAVVGGGNVAMDAARTALRLGAEVHVVYRRSEAELPARVEEVHHAKEEGIIFDLLTNPTEILSDENGWVSGIKCIKMELGEPDASGRRRPVEVEGSEFVIDVDAVIMSLGTSPNPLISSTTKGLESNGRKCIVAAEDTGATSKAGVYAGGDASDMTVLRECGVNPRTTRAVVLALDNTESAKKTILSVRAIAPRAKIFARARNLTDARVLLRTGVQQTFPETIESSFFLGYGLLEFLGVSDKKIEKILSDLRVNNYEKLNADITQGEK